MGTATRPGSRQEQARPGGYRNRTLIVNKSAPAAATLPGASQQQPPPPHQATTRREVIIDGVTFVSDPRGNKLVRKTGKFVRVPSENMANTPQLNEQTSESVSVSTPKRASVSGTTYIRTKGGNLVSLEYARKMKQINDAKATAAKKARLDRLVGIVSDAQAARDAAADFVEYGWCGKGLECVERHALECPEFSEKGTCSKKGCKLPHILKRRNEAESDHEELHTDDDEGGEDDEDDEMVEGQIDWNATKPAKRSLHKEDEDVWGQTGVAQALLGRKRRRPRASDISGQDDFVSLSIPLDDDDDDQVDDGQVEDEIELDGEYEDYDRLDGESVDSAELDVDGKVPSDTDVATSRHRSEDDDKDDAADAFLARVVLPMPSVKDASEDEDDGNDSDDLFVEQLLGQ
ncbi:hypothetical protein OIV83_005044 [Microbotryomycetes sp. JL201]|nr:hypothetical protein OIV83_005044 [Microbotryomycetes sp. JL201]